MLAPIERPAASPRYRRSANSRHCLSFTRSGQHTTAVDTCCACGCRASDPQKLSTRIEGRCRACSSALTRWACCMEIGSPRWLRKRGAILAVGGDVQDGRTAPVNTIGQFSEFDHRALGHDEAWFHSVSDDGQFAGEVVAAGARVASTSQDVMGAQRLVGGRCGRPDVGQVLRPLLRRVLIQPVP